MSVEHNTTESFKLNVFDSKTKLLADRIINQFLRLNKSNQIEFGADIQYVKLSVNGKAVEIECESESNFCNESIFADDSEIMQLVNTEEIRELELQIDYTAMVFAGGNYGYSFIQDIINDTDKATLTNLEYKLLEYYDCDEDVVACELRNGELVYIEPNASFDDLSYIDRWFSYNFELLITVNDDFEESIIEKLNNMAKVIEDKCPNYEFDQYDDDEWAIESSALLKRDDVQIFKDELNSIIDFIKANNLNVSLNAVLKPSGGYQKYAYISIGLDDNGVNLQFAKFQ